MSEQNLSSLGSGNTATDANIQQPTACRIVVIGVGGGGGNSLQHMINTGIDGVEFIAINTDAAALSRNTAPLKVQIGVKLTGGLGAGINPNVGRKAAEESREDIKKLLQGARLIFITAGMGGGTGTGAAPVVAAIAKEVGALTVGVVTRPFSFEGRNHMYNAQVGINELSKYADSLIVVENDKLLRNLGANVSIVNAFHAADDVLTKAVKGISDAITQPAFINLDYNDLVAVMSNRGKAIIGSGRGKGATFIEDALQQAIHSPLIEQVDITSAEGLLAYCAVNPNFPIIKWEEICSELQNYTNDNDATCKFGMFFDDSLDEDEICITVLVAGILGSDTLRQDRAVAQRLEGAQRRAQSVTQESQSHPAPLFTTGSGKPQNLQELVSAQGQALPVRSESRAEGRPLQVKTPETGTPLTGRAPQGQPYTMPHATPVHNPALSEPFAATRSSESQDKSLWEVPDILRGRAD